MRQIVVWFAVGSGLHRLRHKGMSFVVKLQQDGVRAALGGLAAAALALGAMAAPAFAQNRPAATGMVEWGSWISPDGCMYWVADGGAEGYMLDRVDPETGLPVCLAVNTCAVMNTDVLFATDSHNLTAHGRQTLEDFFRNAGAFSYAIYGHTDARASDEYNMRLSERRARAVSQVAASVGAVVDREIGFGERRPVATNATAEGMQQNRRVEIVCYRWQE
jgi:outer membrane protein OmpA-like peptidoglycan-associated protein